MEEMKYFYELYEGLPRGGPGDDESTRRAFNEMLDVPVEPDILCVSKALTGVAGLRATPAFFPSAWIPWSER